MTGRTEATPRGARRTWPQRLLLVLGLVVAAGCFAAANVFWNARTVLASLPRITVSPDVLAVAGGPGDPINVLVAGVDSSIGLDEDDPVRSGRDVEDEARGLIRPDTILLVRLDPATGEAALMSIPRDLLVVGPSGVETRINTVQAVGGVDALIGTLDDNWDVPVNHFVVVDFAGFTELIDLVGGVPVWFPFPTRDLGSGLDVPEAGCWRLDGATSLAYVRARSLEERIDGEWERLAAVAPDIARIERQQQFLVLTLEELLETGRADVGRVQDLVEAGTQAVQVDQALTPGDLIDLANAFREFDAGTLEIATMPREPAFDDDGTYLGEALVEFDAAPLLDRFRGLADGIRPDDISVTTFAASVEQIDRITGELAERGFVSSPGTPVDTPVTTLRFDPRDVSAATLFGRYLEVIPVFEVVDGAEFELAVGPDFAGVRTIPRPEIEVDPVVRAAVTEAAAPPTTTAAPTTTTSEAATGDGAVTTVGEDSSTSTVVVTDEQTGPTTIPVPTTTILRGRPPEGARCVPLGG